MSNLLIDHIREVWIQGGEVLAKGWPLTYRFHCDPEDVAKIQARDEWARLSFTGPGRAELRSIITREGGCEWDCLRELEHDAQFAPTEEERSAARRKIQGLLERVAARVAEGRTNNVGADHVNG